jgi:hypothetical protein
VSAKDAARMAVLYEEVTGRLAEMSLIISRNLGKPGKPAQGLAAYIDLVHVSNSGDRPSGGISPNVSQELPCVISVGDGGCYDRCKGLCRLC